ncbi:MAG: ParB N-terminal domain-containing protein, partial [Gemmataceae bacterium]
MSLSLRNRVRELRLVKANELLPNPKNWRTHPTAQVDALKGLLAEVGIAGAVLVRELPDGRLMLIDGHARADLSGDNEIPVQVLDVSEEEADKILATFDSVGKLAETNEDMLKELLEGVEFDSPAVNEMLEGMLGDTNDSSESE